MSKAFRPSFSSPMASLQARLICVTPSRLVACRETRSAFGVAGLQGVQLRHEGPKEVVSFHALAHHTTHAAAVVDAHATGHLAESKSRPSRDFLRCSAGPGDPRASSPP